MRRLVPAFAAIALASACVAAEGPPGKSWFAFFRPTPEDRMRDMETDRPDKTESPITVDAGHFQLEVDFATYTFDRTTHETTKAWAVAPTNLKFGILNNVDLQLIVETYNTFTTRDHDTGREHRVSGFGDVTLRCKTNFWGNDGGFSAFGIIPFAKFPTAHDDLGNGAVEGGVILPLLLRLSSETEIGTEIEVDQARNTAGDGYHQDFIYSVTVGHDIGKWSGYFELFSDVSNEPHAGWVATFDCGVTYKVTKNVQLDAGVNIGLTDAADDWNPFVGLSVRY
jgi:hypothetical protein